MTTTNRLKYIDITRGFAIILVIIGHVIGKHIGEDFDTKSGLSIIFKLIYSFHMPLFFMLSGLLSERMLRKPILVNIKSKTLRLLIPYYIWTFIFVLFKQLASGIQENNTGWSVFLRSPIDPNPLQYWFLYVLFVMCLVYNSVYVSLNSIEKTNTTLLAISTALVLINPFISNIWISNYFFKNFIYYVIGAFFIDKKRIAKVANRRSALVLLLLFTISELVYFKYAFSTSIAKHYLVILTSIFGSFLFILVFYSFKDRIVGARVLKWLEFNGHKSMEIYCFHPIIAAIIRVVLDKAHLVQNDMMYIIIVILLTIIICNTIAFSMENFRGYKLLFGDFS